jgi:hypothetical protein
MIGCSANRKCEFHVNLQTRYTEAMNPIRVSCRSKLVFALTALALSCLFISPSYAEKRTKAAAAASTKATPINLEVSAVYADINEWGRLRTALSRLQGVSVTISAISIDGALVVLRYEGDLVGLKTLLARAGLDLTLTPKAATLKLAVA